MRAWWLLVVFLCTLWKAMTPASGVVMTINRFFALPHIPRANVEMVIPSAKSTLLCFGACASLQPSCQGFIVNGVDLTQPCTLLIGLNGTKTPATYKVKAYVTRIIDGKVIHYDTTTRNWKGAVDYCASLNKQLIRYPTAAPNAVILEAMNPEYVFIAAITDQVSTNSARDLYSNQLMTVNWAPNRVYRYNLWYMVFYVGNFVDINDFWAPPNTATICMPV
ncbi:uncharacterized protein [Macrobrachium rosenbergii]|uniref:uncharacterized protein n=1 Tax=Macrobrachium rosenbergii TaxID=79674 RepID=UPI0034D59D10